MARYMEVSSSICEILVCEPDDASAAVRGLERFRDDLWGDLFAPIDGEFGNDIDGRPLRYTPSFGSEVQLTPDGVLFSFDSDGVLTTFPEIVPPMIARLRQRLLEAGVQRAEIGWPQNALYLGRLDE
jgi:hypothetical protein